MSRHEPPDVPHGGHVLGFAILKAIRTINAPVRAWDTLTAEEQQRWAAVAEAMMRAAEKLTEPGDRGDDPAHTPHPNPNHIRNERITNAKSEDESTVDGKAFAVTPDYGSQRSYLLEGASSHSYVYDARHSRIDRVDAIDHPSSAWTVCAQIAGDESVMSLPKIPVGIDDFRTLRERDLLYVDKSHLIRGVIDREGSEVVLLPRPRRFGKSLGLSMLRYFFEKRDEDLSHLFKGLEIWRAGDEYRQHFQRYPVIYVTFKNIRPATYEEFWEEIREQLRDLFRYHRAVLDSGRLDDIAAQRYREILDGSASPVLYRRALKDLSSCLHEHYGEKVIILIDEYDNPIHAGYQNEYTDKVLDFFRRFLGDALKGNEHLHGAVLTGILRVARESIFSGLNNLSVYTLLRREFATCFGLTEKEVKDLLEQAGRSESLPDVERWYKGYLFGDQVMYNPWSIMSFLDDAEGKARPHWVSTSDNVLIKGLLKAHAGMLQPCFEKLLTGGSIEQVIDENVALSDLKLRKTEALWSLLVFCGYLRAEEHTQPLMGRPTYLLTIPNAEVRLVYLETFREWIETPLHSEGGNLRILVGALLNGQVAVFEEQLTALVTNVMSVRDGGAKDAENFYHGFVLGLLAVLEPGYHVRSNRESGHGYPDVMIYPEQRGRPGVLMEFKVARKGRTWDEALEEARARIQQKGYTAELEAMGATPIHAYAIAFDGKHVRVCKAEAA